MNNKKEFQFPLIALAAVTVSVIMYLILCSGTLEEMKAFMPLPTVFSLSV